MVCFKVETCDAWEVAVTLRGEIQTKNTCSLGFWDIREGVTLRRLILHILECV